jgi:hypothetical protein
MGTGSPFGLGGRGTSYITSAYAVSKCPGFFQEKAERAFSWKVTELHKPVFGMLTHGSLGMAYAWDLPSLPPSPGR